MLKINKNMNGNFMGLVLSIFPLGLILINIKLFNIGDAAFKPIHVIVITTIILGISRGINLKRFIIMLIYAIIPWFSIINVVSFSDFVSTYLIYLMSLMLIFIGISPALITDANVIQKMFKILFRTFNFSAIYGIIQFLLANIFGNFNLYNNLGRFQFHPHYYNRIFGIDRATSIYIEPSVFAWVAVTILVLALYLMNTPIMGKKELKHTVILATTSVLISFSASGFVSYFLVILLYTFNKKSNYKTILFSWILVSALLLIIIFQPTQLRYLRLTEISRPNTSGYARIIEPFYAMREVFANYPLTGRGLGQIGVYDLNLTYNVYINNSLYGIVITFGILTILYAVPIGISFYRFIKQDKLTLILFANLVLIFISTGSFLSLEMPLIYCLYLFAIRYKKLVDFS